MDAFHIHNPYPSSISTSVVNANGQPTHDEDISHATSRVSPADVYPPDFQPSHPSVNLPLSLVKPSRPLEPLLTSPCSVTSEGKKGCDDTEPHLLLVPVETSDSETGLSEWNSTFKDSIVTCKIVPDPHELHAAGLQRKLLLMRDQAASTKHAYVASKLYRFTSLLSPDPLRPSRKNTRRARGHARRCTVTLLERTLIRVHADSVRKRYSLDLGAPLATDSDNIIILDENDTEYDGLDADADDEFDDDDDEFDDDEDDEIIDDFDEHGLASSGQEHPIGLVLHGDHEEAVTKLGLCDYSDVGRMEPGAGAGDVFHTQHDISAPVSTSLKSQRSGLPAVCGQKHLHLEVHR